MNGLFVIVTLNLLLICDIFRLSIWASQRAAAMGEYSSENSEEKVLSRKHLKKEKVLEALYIFSHRFFWLVSVIVSVVMKYSTFIFKI